MQILCCSFILTVLLQHVTYHAFLIVPHVTLVRKAVTLRQSERGSITSDAIVDASNLLADWDRKFSSNNNWDGTEESRAHLIDAIVILNQRATSERLTDATKGRCMLGICASSADEGLATLKAWVNSLELPRGLLHGMDIEGVPIEFNGGVYIKYNSGGVYTFADIRKSQMGFNALWKPGDAMLEEYDGTYRGVYFQVELSDGEFRQYLLPLDLFTMS